MDVFTAVSDNTRPTWSKTFQDFGIFFNVNQTVTIGSNESLRHMFSPSHICGFLDLEALEEQFYFGNLNLPCFSKQIKKT